jgi:hypothetical protein
MSREISGRQVVADLEELVVAGAIDEVAVTMVREGLLAIAERIGALPRRSTPGDFIERRGVLELVDPKPPESA